jgi:uncharacterized protein YcfJ
MRKSMIALVLAGLSSIAQAVPNTGTFNDWAPTVSTSPVYQEVNNPRQECWTEQVTSDVGYSSDHSYAGAILGGITGGLLGHTVGRGSGRDAATAVGAVTGAIVGDNVGNRSGGEPSTQGREEQHCRTVDNWSRQLTGYNVVFRYGGQQFQTVLPYDPGNAVRVTVSVTPSEAPSVPQSDHDRYRPDWDHDGPPRWDR